MHVDMNEAQRDRLNRMTQQDEKLRSELAAGKIRLDLLMATDRELLHFASGATHQHYKGGLYRYIGVPKDADTGDLLLLNQRSVSGVMEGDIAAVYLHLHPHAPELWVRTAHEFDSDLIPPMWHPAWEPGMRIHRFRPIGKPWSTKQ